MAEQITWSLEERIVQVSELIANNILESALDFRHGAQQTKCLWDGIEILEPQLAELDELLGGVIQKHKLGDALINAVRNGYSTSGYVVGIIMGMHLSGRADLVARFARLYAFDKGAVPANVPRYDDDGREVRSGLLQH